MSHASFGRRGGWCGGCAHEVDDCACDPPVLRPSPVRPLTFDEIRTEIRKVSPCPISDDEIRYIQACVESMKYNPPPPSPEQLRLWIDEDA